MSKWFWRVGLGLHLSFVLLIGFSAYAGYIPNVIHAIPKGDVLCHFLLIGMVGFFVDGVLGFRPLWPGRFEWLRLGPILVICVAGAEELAQAAVPHRSCNIWDFVGDVTGVFFFSWLATRLEQWKTLRSADQGVS